MSSTSVHRYRVGEAQVTVLSDGQRETNVQGFVTNADEASVKAELQQAGLPVDKIMIGFAPILIEQGGKRVLIDAGNGQQAFQESAGQVGRLLESLSAAGVDREEIDVVVCSHFHADHVNGLLMADGSTTFPKAEVCVPEAEWSFWMDDAEMAKAPEGRMKGLFQNNRRVFDALERKVKTFVWDTDIVPGLKAVGTPGHSIGPYVVPFYVGRGAALYPGRYLQSRGHFRASARMARLVRPGCSASGADANGHLSNAGGEEDTGSGLPFPMARSRVHCGTGWGLRIRAFKGLKRPPLLIQNLLKQGEQFFAIVRLKRRQNARLGSFDRGLDRF